MSSDSESEEFLSDSSNEESKSEGLKGRVDLSDIPFDLTFHPESYLFATSLINGHITAYLILPNLIKTFIQ